MKIKINALTYLIIFSFLLCGYFNYFLIISLILICHDIGHIITMKLFKINISSINILPFGSIIDTNIKYNNSSNKSLLISLAGVIMQLFLYIIFYFLLRHNFISNLSYNIFLTYNKSLIIFNLLPIIPLDGSKMLLSIFDRFLPYDSS